MSRICKIIVIILIVSMGCGQHAYSLRPIAHTQSSSSLLRQDLVSTRELEEAVYNSLLSKLRESVANDEQFNEFFSYGRKQVIIQAIKEPDAGTLFNITLPHENADLDALVSASLRGYLDFLSISTAEPEIPFSLFDGVIPIKMLEFFEKNEIIDSRGLIYMHDIIPYIDIENPGFDFNICLVDQNDIAGNRWNGYREHVNAILDHHPIENEELFEKVSLGSSVDHALLGASATIVARKYMNALESHGIKEIPDAVAFLLALTILTDSHGLTSKFTTGEDYKQFGNMLRVLVESGFLIKEDAEKEMCMFFKVFFKRFICNSDFRNAEAVLDANSKKKKAEILNTKSFSFIFSDIDLAYKAHATDLASMMEAAGSKIYNEGKRAVLIKVTYFFDSSSDSELFVVTSSDDLVVRNDLTKFLIAHVDALSGKRVPLEFEFDAGGYPIKVARIQMQDYPASSPLKNPPIRKRVTQRKEILPVVMDFFRILSVRSSLHEKVEQGEISNERANQVLLFLDLALEGNNMDVDIDARILFKLVEEAYKDLIRSNRNIKIRVSESNLPAYIDPINNINVFIMMLGIVMHLDKIANTDQVLDKDALPEISFQADISEETGELIINIDISNPKGHLSEDEVFGSLISKFSKMINQLKGEISYSNKRANDDKTIRRIRVTLPSMPAIINKSYLAPTVSLGAMKNFNDHICSAA